MFTISVVPPNAGDFRYVWSWWDGTVDATTVPYVSKRINMGGIPGMRTLSYRVTIVDAEGQSTVRTGSFLANNPPGIVPSPSVTLNDAAFPYDTQIRVTAYDLDNDPIFFAYYNQDVFLGNGVMVSAGTVDGTYFGTRYPGQNGFTNTFSTTIHSDRELVVKVIDSQSGTSAGTTTFDVALHGHEPAPPALSVSADVQVAAGDIQRVGQGRSVDFSIYAKDVPGSSFVFFWAFYGSFGWAQTFYSAGTTVPQPDGGFKNNVTKSLAPPEYGGNKQVVVTVVNTFTGFSSSERIGITLQANNPPGTPVFVIKDFASLAVVTAPGPVTAGTLLEFAATAVDPEADIVAYFWTFNQPVALPAATLKLWGPKVVVDTTAYPVGSSVQGILECIDRLGGTVSALIPQITIQ